MKNKDKKKFEFEFLNIKFDMIGILITSIIVIIGGVVAPLTTYILNSQKEVTTVTEELISNQDIILNSIQQKYTLNNGTANMKSVDEFGYVIHHVEMLDEDVIIEYKVTVEDNRLYLYYINEGWSEKNIDIDISVDDYLMKNVDYKNKMVLEDTSLLEEHKMEIYDLNDVTPYLNKDYLVFNIFVHDNVTESSIPIQINYNKKTNEFYIGGKGSTGDVYKIHLKINATKLNGLTESKTYKTNNIMQNIAPHTVMFINDILSANMSCNVTFSTYIVIDGEKYESKEYKKTLHVKNRGDYGVMEEEAKFLDIAGEVYE